MENKCAPIEGLPYRYRDKRR